MPHATHTRTTSYRFGLDAQKRAADRRWSAGTDVLGINRTEKLNVRKMSKSEANPHTSEVSALFSKPGRGVTAVMLSSYHITHQIFTYDVRVTRYQYPTSDKSQQST